MHSVQLFSEATHVAELGGERVFFTTDSFEAACDELVKKHGGSPQVTPLERGVGASTGLRKPVEQPAPAAPAAAVAVAQRPARTRRRPSPNVNEKGIDAVGQLRSEMNRAAAVAMGFSPREPVFARGTRVVQAGVDNAELSRMEHEAKPLVKEYTAEFVELIKREDRRDLIVPAARVVMMEDGTIAVPREAVGAQVKASHARYLMDERAIAALGTRLGMKHAGYLEVAWPALRAYNVNEWAKKLERDEQLAAEEAAKIEDGNPFEPAHMKLRSRTNHEASKREVFGVVSPTYTSFDVDQIAEALHRAAPEDARGTVTYDGQRARMEVMFHSNVQPEEYVAGEYFKAGVIITTDDTGGGSCVVSACVWQNLCLNLIIIDRARQVTARIRHVGSVEELARRFQSGFAEALSKIGPFQAAWGYALSTDVLADNPNVEEGLSLEDALPGIFNGCIERELVPVRGRRVEVVRDLVSMYEKDESAARVARPGIVTRAAVVNAFTRYAHEVEAKKGPWGEDHIQRAAGALVYYTKPLPFEAIELT